MAGKEVFSPRELARATGVSESSFKRWIDAGLLTATRSPGGHRRVALADALQFIRENRFNVLHPQLLGLPAIAQVDPLPAPGMRTAARLLFDALCQGDRKALRDTLLACLMSSASVAEVCDRAVSEAQQRLVHAVAKQPQRAFLAALAQPMWAYAFAAAEIVADGDDRPLAMAGCCDDPAESVAGHMLAAVLAEHGYQSINLGSGVELEAFCAAADHFRPAVICVHGQRLHDEHDGLEALRRIAARIRARVIAVGAPAGVAPSPGVVHAENFGRLSEHLGTPG